MARLPAGRPARGLAAITSGTATGHLLTVAVTPVLARLYSPADFGTFSVLSAVALILATASALRFEYAIPLPESTRDARNLLVLGLIAVGSSWLLTTLLVLAFGSELSGALGNSEISRLLPLATFVAAVLGAFQLLNHWALRQSRYGAIGRRNFLQAVVMTGTQLLLGWRGWTGGGLITGMAAGQSAGALSLIPGSGLAGHPRPSGGELWRLLRRYSRFALILAPSGLINASGIYIVIFLVSALYGSAAAGYLGFAQRLVGLPLLLIGQAVAQVYLGELSRKARQNEPGILTNFILSSKRLAVLGLVLGVGIAVLAPSAFVLLFGDEWAPSGRVAQALSLVIAAQFIAAPLAQTLVVYEHVVTQLTWDVSRLVVGAFGILSAFWLGASMICAVWLYSATSALLYLWYWELCRRAATRAAGT